MIEIAPCIASSPVVEIVNSLGVTITTCLTIYLASARVRANRDLEVKFRELQLRMEHSTNKIVDSVEGSGLSNSTS